MNNLRYAIRQLRKSPGFTLVAVLILALGIGANTAIFTVVHAVLVAPLPYADSDRIVAVQSRNLQENLTRELLSPAGFRELEKQATSFEAIAAGRYNYDNLTRIDKPTTVTASLVTQDYFRVLGESALIGRTFTREDAAANAKPVVVLSYDIWQKQYGGRADIIGEPITIADLPHEVVGVMPRTFKDPFGISVLWRLFPNEGGENAVATSRFWGVIGRVRPGVPVSSVQAELSTIAGRFAQSDPKFYKGWDFGLSPLHNEVVGDFREGLLLVVGAALVVLLITCANVAGLQFVRASTRQREVAIRLALGASRTAIAREQLIESFLLVALGGIGGVLIGSWGLDLLLAGLARDWIPRADEIALNLPVLFATGVMALFTGLVFGLYPAWRATKIDAIDSLRDGSKGSSGLQSVRLRGALVIAQIALTLVLLVCAGLVWKSFAKITGVNPGIQIENTLSMVLTLAPTRYDTSQKRTDYYRQVFERVSTLPGVDAAAFTQTMPFTWGIPATFSVYGSSDDAAKLPPAFYDSVSPSYFSALHIPLVAGRTFAETDDSKAPSVIILSQSAARKFFPGEDPIGKRLLLPPSRQQPNPVPLEVIGLVGDVPRNGLNAATPCQVYASLNQRAWAFSTLLVRSPLPVETLSQTIQRAIWEFNPEQTISNVTPVRTLVKQTLTQPQLYLTLFSMFALLALLLASIGLYGLIAYSVAQRTREFGIRFALGAQVRDVLRLVLGQGARLTAFGLVLGLLAAAGVARLMETLLFRTTAYDPLVFGGVVFVLAVIALLAALLPALRAAKADPVAALRAE
ncbi:MAG TPA: ABC transporter permease [Chthoniobacterales bacterium]|nr:ABC transporter permease [Chthoniobacterales bacterium]